MGIFRRRASRAILKLFYLELFKKLVRTIPNIEIVTTTIPNIEIVTTTIPNIEIVTTTISKFGIV